MTPATAALDVPRLLWEMRIIPKLLAQIPPSMLVFVTIAACSILGSLLSTEVLDLCVEVWGLACPSMLLNKKRLEDIEHYVCDSQQYGTSAHKDQLVLINILTLIERLRSNVSF